MSRIAAAGLAVLLTSCGPRPDADVCSTPLAITALNNMPSSMKAENCLHRWAYRLSDNNESLDDVVDAVMGGCEEPVNIYISTMQQGFPVDATVEDDTTGKPIPIGLYHRRLMVSKARFYVLQGRQGHCRVRD